MNYSIFNDLTSLTGVNSRVYSHLKRLLPNTRIIDLLLHSPINVLNRFNNLKLNTAQPGEILTIKVRITAHIPTVRKTSPYKILCDTDDGNLTLAFFHANKHYLQKILPVGSEKIISGKIDKFSTIVHPDYIVNNEADIKKIEPIYPLTMGISNKLLINIIKNSLTLIPDLPEWIDQESINKHHWKTWKETIMKLHNPNNIDELATNKERLAYDEFLAYQLQLQKTRHNHSQQDGRIIKGDKSLQNILISRLPFKLTQGQIAVIEEIIQDQTSNKRMIRLLQGDVGSGKTIVALIAILNAVENGSQAALMVPTEILAVQHTNWITAVIGDKVNVELLIGKTKAKERDKINQCLSCGETKIIIGTHALFQDKLQFKDLALAVIDEQHRFGVKQRTKFLEKGNKTDLLLISATPIPRTLNLTLYGDIDCSILREKPKQRLPIKTSIMQKKQLPHVVEKIEHAVTNGAKIYWVCPLIEESEKMDLAAALDRFNHLHEIFGEQVELVHGKMKQQQREETILKFKNSEIAILVSTTVIEVGIDVPDATIMIIENAERFGLSQLHQLRGRVGRGDKQSFCILLYENTSKITYRRLAAVRDSNDGFYIAEQDLKIRGGGEAAGYKQSGIPDFRFINLEEENIPCTNIYQQAQKIINLDPSLTEFKTLLSIFNQEISSFS